MPSRADVLKVVESVRDEDGVLVYDFPSRKLLAARMPAHPPNEHTAALIVLGLGHRPNLRSMPDPFPEGSSRPVAAKTGPDQGGHRVTDLRPFWACTDCGVTVRNVSGEPIPEPRKWKDDRCPRCRINYVAKTEGAAAGKELDEKLFGRRRGPAPKEKSQEPKPKPKYEPPEVEPLSDDEHAAVERALLGTYDSDQEIARTVGVFVGAVSKLRNEKDLPVGATRRADAGRQAVAAAIAEHSDWNDRQMAEHLGLDKGHVARYRRQLGVLKRPSPAPSARV
jgi:hypothetical protein